MNLFYKLVDVFIEEEDDLYFGEIRQCLPDYHDWQIREALQTGILAGIIKRFNSLDKYGIK